jgi:anthranilate synthase component II
MILLIDNYDSFVFNLHQMVASIGFDSRVVRNDKITVEQVLTLNPQAVVLSPGPGRPTEAGITMEIIRKLAGRIPIFGVCLGHQAIGEAFGGKVIRAHRPCHGKQSLIHHENGGVFNEMPSPFLAARYHSLVVERDTLPDCLEITAETDDMIMGLRHRTHLVEGVQFHPESMATIGGYRLLQNFLRKV